MECLYYPLKVVRILKYLDVSNSFMKFKKRRAEMIYSVNQWYHVPKIDFRDLSDLSVLICKMDAEPRRISFPHHNVESGKEQVQLLST